MYYKYIIIGLIFIVYLFIFLKFGPIQLSNEKHKSKKPILLLGFLALLSSIVVMFVFYEADHTNIPKAPQITQSFDTLNINNTYENLAFNSIYTLHLTNSNGKIYKINSHTSGDYRIIQEKVDIQSNEFFIPAQMVLYNQQGESIMHNLYREGSLYRDASALNIHRRDPSDSYESIKTIEYHLQQDQQYYLKLTIMPTQLLSDEEKSLYGEKFNIEKDLKLMIRAME